MNPMTGLFNLFCVGLMVWLYRQPKHRKTWRKWVTVSLGVLNLMGAYYNLLA